MVQPGNPASEPLPPIQFQSSPPSGSHGFLRKLFGRQNGAGPVSIPAELPPQDQQQQSDPNDPEKTGLIHRMSRKVVPGLPRAQTFKRQQSERRDNLAPVEPTPDERRAISVDHRPHGHRASSASPSYFPRTSAPGILSSSHDDYPHHFSSLPNSPVEAEMIGNSLDRGLYRDDDITLTDDCIARDTLSTADTQSLTTSQYDAMIHDELEKKWILNLSMHFRDRSRREKFFVTYREQDYLWRRVTISLDYRNAPPNSLEMDLIQTHYQRDKSAKIYEAIRESLLDIQFYETVTNLKLQTTDGRLHVHVVEDGNEIINYPTVSQIDHLGCRRVRERDIIFDSHMSGFVYKVTVNGQTFIKKEIPSPDTVDEFLYEVNALSCLGYSENVIKFHGVVVDDHDEHIKGLLISYAEKGALIDIIYERCKESEADIPWHLRERWARQIVKGLSDIHESGFVQGDFTLSNIVIDENSDAKIIDINRRGCPVGWEPPEATPLIERNQRISMYIGVKSDLYQLGMVLWALATQEDEPEAQGRPLFLGPEVNIPDWYRKMAEICLSNDPRDRLQASSLLQMFPPRDAPERGRLSPPPPPSTDDEFTLRQYLGDRYDAENYPEIRTVEPPSDWSYVSRPYADASPLGYEPYYYTRGRSPPSPITSNYGRCNYPGGMYDIAAWAANRDIPSSYSDVGVDNMPLDETPRAEVSDMIDANTKSEQTVPVFGETTVIPEVDMTKPLAVDVPESQRPNREPATGLQHEGAAADPQDSSHDDSNAKDAKRDVCPAKVVSPKTPTVEAQPTERTDSMEHPVEEYLLHQGEGTLGIEEKPPVKAEGISKEDSRPEDFLPTHPKSRKDSPRAYPEDEGTVATRQVSTAKLGTKDPESSGSTAPDCTEATTETPRELAILRSSSRPAGDTTARDEGPFVNQEQPNSADEVISAPEERAPDRARQLEALNGIGAVHLMNDDEKLGKKDMADEDFNMLIPSTQPGPTNATTTDSTT